MFLALLTSIHAFVSFFNFYGDWAYCVGEGACRWHWVALIEDIHGSGLPQFPSSLQWIAKNQLPDGWSNSEFFVVVMIPLFK